MKQRTLLFFLVLLSTLAASAQTDLTGATVTLNPNGYDYDGTECTPKVSGIRKGRISYNSLVAGVDYDLTYSNNVNAGQATATLTFKGYYTGVASRTFTINPMDLSREETIVLTLDVEEVKYDGTEKKPAVSDLYYNGQLLVPDVDYDLSYKNNRNPGTATVTALFKGNYAGSKVTNFVITPSYTDCIVYDYDTDTKQAKVVYGSYYTGSITIPETVTYDDVTYSVTSIGERAFSDCPALTSVTIPNSVTSIDNFAFYECSSLTKVELNSNAIVSKDYSSYTLRHVFGEQVKEYILGDNITSIGDDAFSACTGLTSVTIPNSVTSIGDDAFSACTGLTSVTIPNSVTSIGDYVFLECSGLTKVTIPNSVTSIGNYAFRYCSGMTEVTIPNSLTSIGDGAFSGCSGLTSISVENGNTVYDSRNNCNAIIETASNTLIVGCQNTIIPNSVKLIEDYAFYACTGLTSVTISNSVTSIGSNAFSGCYVDKDNFINNSSLDAEANNYWGCNLLDSRENGFCISNGVLIKYTGSESSVTIPNNVTSIGDNAFNGCPNLTEVTIPNSVTSIGESAFGYCSNLKSVTIGNSVTSIGKYAFDKCSGLKSVIIGNSVTSIGVAAFSNCTGLTTVTIPNSVTEIGGWVFSGCSSLTSVTLPNSVKSIRDNSFYGCTGLTSVTIPNSVTYIGGDAFYGCTGLTEMTIPNSVTYIGGMAFYFCRGLTSVTIPNSVTYIGGNAFSYCKGLTEVNCYAEMLPSTGYDIFNSVPISSAILHVPATSVEAYKATSPWSGFGSIVALSETLRGDANGDGEIGMPDVMFVVNYILGNPAATFNEDAADANLDGEIGMPDVMFIVNYILNGKFPDEE